MTGDRQYEPGMRPGTEDVTCPYGCQGEPIITRSGHEQTMLGSLRPDVDSNHHWLQCTCHACGKSFTKEWRCEKSCYSERVPDGVKLVRGEPVCWERYVNDPRAGQCQHLHVKYKDGRWYCQRQDPGTVCDRQEPIEEATVRK